HALIVVDVQPAKGDLVAILLGQLVKYRQHELARAAPSGPKVHEDRPATAYGLFKVLFRKLQKVHVRSVLFAHLRETSHARYLRFLGFRRCCGYLRLATTHATAAPPASPPATPRIATVSITGLTFATVRVALEVPWFPAMSSAASFTSYVPSGRPVVSRSYSPRPVTLTCIRSPTVSTADFGFSSCTPSMTFVTPATSPPLTPRDAFGAVLSTMRFHAFVSELPGTSLDEIVKLYRPSASAVELNTADESGA